MLYQMLVCYLITLVSGQVVPMYGLDCDQSPVVHNFDAQDLCKNTVLDLGLKQTLVVAQVLTATTHKGLKCTMHRSKFDLICGMFSHEKFLTIPEISKADPIMPYACQDIFLYGSTARIDSFAVTLAPGTEIQYQYVSAGHMRHETDNAQCVGGTVQINGENITSVIEMVTRNLVTERVQIEVSLDEKTVIDLTNGDKLSPDALHVTNNYIVNAHSYYINYERPLCDVMTIDSVEFDVHQVNGSTWFVNANRKLAFQHTGNTSKCHQNTLTTQYQNVVLFNDANPNVNAFNGVFLDIEIEEKLSTDYVLFQEAREVSMLRVRLCREMSAIAQHLVPSPYHANAFIRRRNDIITEIVCTRVQVHAIIGEQVRNFCTSTLPIYYQNKKRELQSDTRIIVEQMSNETVAKIPCVTHLLPVFASKDRSVMLIATPKITQINVSIESSHPDGDEVSLIDHLGQDVLYKAKQLNEWKNYLAFKTVHESVLLSLTNTICQGGNQCENFAVDQEQSSFPIHLLHPIKSLTQYLRNEIFYLLTSVGNVCSLLIGAYFAMHYACKIWHFVALSKRTSRRDAFRHVFITPRFPHPPVQIVEPHVQEAQQEAHALVPYVHRMYR